MKTPKTLLSVTSLIAIFCLISTPIHASQGLRIYTVAANFLTVRDSVTWDELQARWHGTDSLPLAMDQATYDQLHEKLGNAGSNVQIIPSADYIDYAQAHPDAWLIVPFDELSPRLKVLQIDDWDIFNSRLAAESLSTSATPLSPTLSPTQAEGKGENPIQSDIDSYPLAFPSTDPNYDPTYLTTIAMTGVTAMTRDTAAALDKYGAEWATADMTPVFQDIDFVHTSNEVSFYADCPRQGKVQLFGDLCAKDSYLDVLKDLHINIVELTGNHNNDYGYQADLRTLQIYRDNGIATFGGGENQAAAQQPLVIHHNGNSIIFVGCNWVGPVYAWATASTPGAARCQDSWLDPVLATPNAVKILDVQYEEYDQSWPVPMHRADFTRYAQAGADVVIGTQAHQPQTFDFVGDSFMHFGLGNFIFDQQKIEQTQFFIDKLIIYRGRLLSVQLQTGVIEDRARPRLMTLPEREKFLDHMFSIARQNNGNR